MLTIELPYPPSLNHYYRHVGYRTLISRQGRAYREAVVKLVGRLGLVPILGPLDLRIELFPPDRRRRDADNAQKALLDALAHGGVYGDDSQIVHLDTWKRAPVTGGKAVVRIVEIAAEENE